MFKECEPIRVIPNYDTYEGYEHYAHICADCEKPRGSHHTLKEITYCTTDEMYEAIGLKSKPKDFTNPK